MNTYFSQFGEDRILADIFQGRRSGTCVEVGANDGVQGSTTLFFEKLGWKCILVEPNPDLCAEIKSKRSAVVIECAASNTRGTVALHVAEGAWRADAMSTVSTREEDQQRIRQQGFTTRSMNVATATLDELLTAAGVESGIDFVSIDVEGHETQVIEGFSLGQWRPRIVIVEDNSNAASNVTNEQLAKDSYIRFMRTGVNDWYAHRSDRELVTLKSRITVRVVLWAVRIRARLRRVRVLRWIRDTLRGR
jgi:FkbM family methyltransferase